MSGVNAHSPYVGISQREPPANLQAEQALLGAIFHNNKLLDRVPFLEPECFADPIHQRIFQLIQRKIDAGQIADAVTLKADLEHSGVLAEVGGTAYLAQLLAATIGLNLVRDYGQVIHETWLRRRVIDIHTSALELAFGADPGIDLMEQLTAAQDNLALIANTYAEASGDQAKRGATLLGDAVSAVLDRADMVASGKIPRPRSTGIEALDQAIGGGLADETLIYLAALGESGKTELALQVAENIGTAVREEWIRDGQQGACPGIPFFSFDMSATQIATRTVGRLSGVMRRRIRRGELDAQEAYALVRARDKALTFPIEIYDDEPSTLARVVRDIRAFCRRRPCAVAIIDNLTKIVGEEKPGTPLFPLYLLATNTLKKLSKELKIPILLLIHLPQSVAKREGSKPKRGDLPYGIHAHADYAIGLWRPILGLGEALVRGKSAEADAKAVADWEAKKEALRDISELVPMKVREDDGDGGQIARMRFDRALQRFISIGGTGA